jgi:hypothetical protein
MPKYEVFITHTIWSSTIIEAEDDFDAYDKAYERRDNKYPKAITSAGHTIPWDDYEVTEVVEIEE